MANSPSTAHRLEPSATMNCASVGLHADVPLGLDVQRLRVDLAQHVAEVEVRLGDLGDVAAADLAQYPCSQTAMRRSSVASDDGLVRAGPIVSRAGRSWCRAEGACRPGTWRRRAPQREAVAVQGAVRQLEALAHQAEDDRVLAGVVAGAEGVQADLAPRALADQAVAAVDEPIRARADRLADDLGQPQRGAARGVLLEVMVPLDDLDVGRVAQAPAPPRRPAASAG